MASADYDQVSFMYNKLLRDENDVVGMVAYSMYKSSEIGYIKDFRRTRGTEPSDEDLKRYRETQSNDNQIKIYYDSAQARFVNTINYLQDKKIKELDNKESVLTEREKNKSRRTGVQST